MAKEQEARSKIVGVRVRPSELGQVGGLGCIPGLEAVGSYVMLEVTDTPNPHIAGLELSFAFDFENDPDLAKLFEGTMAERHETTLHLEGIREVDAHPKKYGVDSRIYARVARVRGERPAAARRGMT